jgi:Rad3-related DNA helicase
VESGALDADPSTRAETERRAEAVVSALREVESAIKLLMEAMARVLCGAGKKDALRYFRESRDEPEWQAVHSEKERACMALTRLADACASLSSRLESMVEGTLFDRLGFMQDLRAAASETEALRDKIGFVLAAEDAGHVYWLQRVTERQGGVRAWAAPVDIGPMLHEALYEQKESIVFTSATLTVAGSSAFLKRRLGIDRIDSERLMELNVGTPFDFTRQCAVLVPTFLPEPDEPGRDYAVELGQLLAAVFRHTRGRGMALFTSYQMLRNTTRAMEHELEAEELQVLAQGVSGSRETITELFKENLESVLMGTHSFWEGVDVVGEALSCLVVARLPFAVFTDPIIDARCRRVEEEGGNAFMDFSLPNAVIKFRQGFGRLIRHRTDRGIVIVADRRIVSKRYGRWFQRSLPVRTVAAGDRQAFLEAVEGFFEEG